MLIGRSDLFNMHVRELQIKANAMRTQFYSQKRCEILKQTHEVLVDIYVDHEQLLKESKNTCVEEIDNIA